MSAQADIEAELSRLRNELESVERPDPVDVAVVDALASQEVQALLVPILEDGAFLVGAVLEAAGSIEGVIQLTFECDWPPGISRLTRAPAVAALVEVAPPRTLWAERITAPAGPPGVRFAPPVGAVPPALRSVSFPSASEVLRFNLEATRSFQEWLATAALSLPLPIGGGGGAGLTTGTKCSGLLCFEKSSDDFDFPKQNPNELL